MTFDLFFFHSVSFIQFSPPNSRIHFSSPHTSHNAQPATFPFVLSTKDYFMNNKYHKVLLCVILCSRQLYPPTYTHTSPSTPYSRTLSADVLPCHLFHVHSYFFLQRDGWVPFVHKELDGRYSEVGIASFVHASDCGCLTQQSSLKSLITWIGFRQTLAL